MLGLLRLNTRVTLGGVRGLSTSAPKTRDPYKRLKARHLTIEQYVHKQTKTPRFERAIKKKSLISQAAALGPPIGM